MPAEIELKSMCKWTSQGALLDDETLFTSIWLKQEILLTDSAISTHVTRVPI